MVNTLSVLGSTARTEPGQAPCLRGGSLHTFTGGNGIVPKALVRNPNLFQAAVPTESSDWYVREEAGGTDYKFFGEEKKRNPPGKWPASSKYLCIYPALP